MKKYNLPLKPYYTITPKKGSGKMLLVTSDQRLINAGQYVCDKDDDSLFCRVKSNNTTDGLIEIFLCDSNDSVGMVSCNDVMMVIAEVSEEAIEKKFVSNGDAFESSDFKLESYTRRPDDGEVLTVQTPDDNGILSIGEKVTVYDTFSCVVTVKNVDGKKIKLYEDKLKELNYTVAYFIYTKCIKSYI